MSRPSPLASIRRLIRRHRRPLAAALAAAAALLALTSLRAPVAPASAGVPSSYPGDPSGLRPGEVAVPVVLTTATVAAALQAGDLIDLVTTTSQGAPSVAAQGVRVLQAATTGGFTSSASAVVMVAVAESNALDIAVSPDTGFSVIVQTMADPDGTH